MIVQKDFLNKLKDFGLNTYESKLWTALLSRGISTAGELSDIANVPRSRSYDVLESLERKGFIVMKIGKPIKYIAVPPAEVLERVKKKIELDAARQIKVVNSIKESEILEELNMLHNQSSELVNPVDLNGSIKGRNNMYNHIESIMKNANKSIILMTTPKGLIRKANMLKNVMEKAKKKGVKIKIGTQITKDNKEAINLLSKYADIKHTEKEARFCVIDGQEVFFMLMDEKVPSNYDAGIWVKTPAFASTLENFFDSVWNNMTPASKVKQ